MHVRVCTHVCVIRIRVRVHVRMHVLLQRLGEAYQEYSSMVESCTVYRRRTVTLLLSIALTIASTNTLIH